MGNPMYGSNKFDANLGNDKYLENKLALVSWNFGHLHVQLAADTTEAKSRSGITLIDGQIAESLGVGDTGAAATTLPAATYGALCVYRHSGQFDGGENHVISCATGESFKAGSMSFQVEAQEVLHLMTPVYTTSYTPTVAIGSGEIVSIADGNNTLTYTGTATNNQTHIGSEWAFFCETEGVWTVSFRGVELGTGAVNTNLAFTTA